MRDIESIDDPKWQDLYDREAEIRRLKQEIDELRADLQERDATIAQLRLDLRHKTALLGVP